MCPHGRRVEDGGPSQGAKWSASVLLAVVGLVALGFVSLMVYPFILPYLPGRGSAVAAVHAMQTAETLDGDADSPRGAKEVAGGRSGAVQLLTRACSKGKRSKWEKRSRHSGGKHQQLATEDADDDDDEELGRPGRPRVAAKACPRR